MATETSDERSFDFESYFRSNYEDTTRKYLTFSRVMIWARRISFALMFTAIVIFLLGSLQKVLRINYYFAAIGFEVAAIVFQSIRTLYRWRRARLDVSRKDVLAYHLFKASELLKRYDMEQHTQRKNSIMDRCLMHVSEFRLLLKDMLERSARRMPLALPDIRQLSQLNKNVINRLYPTIQNHHTGAEILLTLSSIFSLEREYDQLSKINEMLEAALDPEPFEEEEGLLTRALINPMKRSLAFASFVSLVVIVASTILAICLFRVPVKGWTIDLTYIADNAATIVIGILAGWAALIFIISPRYRQD